MGAARADGAARSAAGLAGSGLDCRRDAGAGSVGQSVGDVMSEMISFGGGVNSVAMTVMLVEEGWRGPVVFVDPGAEMPETYCYLEYFERHVLKPHGMTITRISASTNPTLYDDKRVVENQTLEGFCLARGIIPLLSVRWCSTMFKRTPLEAWRKAAGIDTTCIGMAADEPRRVRDDPAVRYPLVERGINRAECHRIIQRAGLPPARKSGCFFCPGQQVTQWRNLYLDHPDLFERAMALEEHAGECHQKNATLDPHGVALREMAARRWEGLQKMDLSRWMPCVCGL